MIINDYYSTQRRPQATDNKIIFFVFFKGLGCGGILTCLSICSRHVCFVNFGVGWVILYIYVYIYNYIHIQIHIYDIYKHIMYTYYIHIHLFSQLYTHKMYISSYIYIYIYIYIRIYYIHKAQKITSSPKTSMLTFFAGSCLDPSHLAAL